MRNEFVRLGDLAHPSVLTGVSRHLVSASACKGCHTLASRINELGVKSLGGGFHLISVVGGGDRDAEVFVAF